MPDLATEIARLIYETGFEGYFKCAWADLPAAQKWRHIRTANAVIDRIERRRA